MVVILLIVIVIILLIFLSGQILEAIGDAISAIAILIVGVVKSIIYLVKKTLANKRRKTVIVTCPCSTVFKTQPKEEDGWIVNCPKCGKRLRVDMSKKKP